MHILSCSLTLLLACAATAAAAGGASFDSLLGFWKGNVKSSPDSCIWAVESAVRAKTGVFTGTFTYAGKCAEKKSVGTFTIKPIKKPGCFSAIAAVKGSPEIKLTGCADDAGLVKFSCPAFKGTMRFSKDGSSAKLVVDAGMGGAAGTLRRTAKKPAGWGGAARKKAAVAEGGEVWVGGDAPDETGSLEVRQSRD